jgi:hypothetical protein
VGLGSFIKFGEPDNRNLKLQVLEVLRRDEVGDVIRAARSSQAEALNILSSPFLASLTRDIVAFAAEYRLPAIYQWKEQVEAGGLYRTGPVLQPCFGKPRVSSSKSSRGQSLDSRLITPETAPPSIPTNPAMAPAD